MVGDVEQGAGEGEGGGSTNVSFKRGDAKTSQDNNDSYDSLR